MVFVKKWTFFLTFFLSKRSKKETFFYILDRKECFLDLKSEVLTKSKNIDILQRGQSMAFLTKSTVFLYVFFLTKKSQKERVFDILDRKESFLDLKSEVVAKSKKSTFCNGVSPWFFSNNQPFSYMFFFQPKMPERNIFFYSGQ